MEHIHISRKLESPTNPFAAQCTRALPPGGPLHRQEAGQLRRARGFSPRAAGQDAGPGRGAREKGQSLMFVPGNLPILYAQSIFIFQRSENK
ncbi:MAG: hypothetical protein IIB62_10680 [Proteobacteria bacterium]|nr:hypothetical protein [Pseudomonadota bacterium]